MILLSSVLVLSVLSNVYGDIGFTANLTGIEFIDFIHFFSHTPRLYNNSNVPNHVLL